MSLSHGTARPSTPDPAPGVCVFIGSATTPKGFPPPSLPEISFLGRSNVGKSSLLNRLAGRRGLAHVSRTPGRTRMLNFFQVGASHRFVDFPGYGYAKAPGAVRATWEGLVLAYLTGRECLRLNLMLVDSRRDPQGSDRRAFELLSASGRPLAVVATKADKLSRSESARRIRLLEESYGNEGAVPVIPCSVRRGRRGAAGSRGIGRVRRLIAEEVRSWR